LGDGEPQNRAQLGWPARLLAEIRRRPAGDLLASLPESLLDFLQSRGISAHNFAALPPWYFRLKPGATPTLEQLSEDIGVP